MNKDKKLSMAVLGFGQRGIVFSNEAKKFPDEVELVAVCDTDKSKFDYIKENYNLKDDQIHEDPASFFKLGKLADFLVIATPDKAHYAQAMKALEIGYNLLLEKPIALNAEEVLAIRNKANELNLKVAIAHVLRYTPFYQSIKEVIESGEIGQVVTLSQTENVGYFHYAHSYVRGNWRNLAISGPMILTKASHDLDIIRYLVGNPVKKISSFGNLFYFKKENKPEGVSKYSIDCHAHDPYNSYEFYKNNPEWMKLFTLETDVEKVMQDKSHNYGLSVYDSDNDVVDHQVVNMLFKNGQTASFLMTAFSNETHREIRVHGTLGEIIGDMETNKFSVSRFNKNIRVVDVSIDNEDLSYHSGGDKKLLKDFVDAIREDKSFLTDINHSVESHYLAFAAEQSRVNEGEVVDMQPFFKDYERS